MTAQGVRPEDILANDINQVERNGVLIRKGTVAAALANIDLLEANTSSDADKQAAITALKELADALLATGICKHVTWKNPQVQEILEEAASI